MTPSESIQPTPAQLALLQFVNNESADTLYESLSATLSLLMTSAASPGLPLVPAPATFDNWYYVLHLMERLHAISAESPQ